VASTRTVFQTYRTHRRHLVLLHRLKKRRLRFGGVRLISSASSTFAKTGPFTNASADARHLHLQNLRARDIRRHQIRRELNPLKLQMKICASDCTTMSWPTAGAP